MQDAGDLDVPIIATLSVIDTDTVTVLVRGGNCESGCWVDVTFQAVIPWHPAKCLTLYPIWPWRWPWGDGHPPCRIVLTPQAESE